MNRPEPASATISLRRAFGEILAVYVPAFGLGILSALMILHDPGLGSNQVTGPVTALEEILQYVMQASVTIFGVAFFCLQRGVTLRRLFGGFRVPEVPAQPAYPYPYPYPQQSLVTPAWGAAQQPPQQQWPGYAHYMAPRPPVPRSKGWQFTRSYFISLAGVLGFLLSVVIYTSVTHFQTGAPSEGSSPYLVPVGLIVALSAGFGEEMLVTGLTVNSLEAAGVKGKNVWLIYVVAICLRIPFHLYYGWASLGVVIFTVVNIWVYRRWRLLWPIVLAHATYDFVEYLGSVAPPALAGLLLLGLALATIVMVILIICYEVADRGARRRYAQHTAAAEAAEHAYTAQMAAAQAGPVVPPSSPYGPPSPPYGPPGPPYGPPDPYGPPPTPPPSRPEPESTL